MIKSKRKILSKSNIKYNNCDIPAKLFFNQLIQGDSSVLGIGTPEELHKAYFDIIDEYCELDNNKKLLELFTTQEKISRMQNTQIHIKSQIYNLKYLCETKEHVLKVKEVLDEIQRPVIKFDPDKGIEFNIKRLEMIIGSLNNNIKMLIPTEKIQKKQVKTDFNKRLVNVENALNREINEDVTLRKFIYLEKSAIERNKPKTNG